MTLCLLKPLHSEEKRTKIPRSFSLHLFSSQLGQEKDQEIAIKTNKVFRALLSTKKTDTKYVIIWLFLQKPVRRADQSK